MRLVDLSTRISLSVTLLACLIAGGDVAAALGEPAWYSPDWQYRQAITILVPPGADLTDHPTDVDLADDSDLRTHARPDLRDVVFTAANGVSPIPAAVTPPMPHPVFTLDGAWSWFGDPRAIHYRGVFDKTYVGWVDRRGDIRVGEYDHDLHDITVTTVHRHLDVDDHAAPGLVVLPDGRLMVFYSAHNGPKLYFRKSARPESVAGWGPEFTIPVNTPGVHGFTYPSPVLLKGERNTLYLFWRGGDWEPTFSVSTDGGAHWTPGRTLFKVGLQRPYLKVTSDGDRTIHFAVSDGHPNIGTGNIYYFSYHAGGFHRANGTFIKALAHAPVLANEADKVHNAPTAQAKGWVWDIAANALGRPVIVYATFPSFPAGTDHRYHYARWTGARWEDHEITHAGATINAFEPEYSGGVVLDHDDPARVYLSRQTGAGSWGVERWTTPDGGRTWSHVPVPAASSGKNMRPVVPLHHAPDLQVLWMTGEYAYYTKFATALKVFPALARGAGASGEAEVEVEPGAARRVTVFMYYGHSSAVDQLGSWAGALGVPVSSPFASPALGASFPGISYGPEERRPSAF